MQHSVFSDRTNRWEKILFIIFSLINLLPLFTSTIFPTIDGAAHLNNAVLFRHLVSGNEFLEQYFMFNHEPVPNWSGHILLMLLDFFLPPLIALKMLQVLIIGLLPFAFRYLVVAIAPQNRYFSFLIFQSIYFAFCICLVLI